MKIPVVVICPLCDEKITLSLDVNPTLTVINVDKIASMSGYVSCSSVSHKCSVALSA